MLEIKAIDNNLIGEEIGLEIGDILVSYNSEKFIDILDYFYMESLTEISLEIERKGKRYFLDVEKYEDESFGLSFVEEIKTRTCHNKCVFCFVDQIPKGMRETLYIKDDDYRLSFISGNYVTMTNDTDEDLDRIIKLKLSPIYVSVHATNKEVREKMLSNKFAGKILEQIEKLTSNGIEIHAQVVLCDGLNDGKVLEQTMLDLYKFYPKVKSLAIVPVGLTQFRENLYPLKFASKEFAKRAIETIIPFQEKCKNEVGDHFVHCSDEFYSLAQTKLPKYEEYGDFPQIENGVGLIRYFENEFLLSSKEQKDKTFNSKKTLIATGTSFYPYLVDMLKKVGCPHEVMAVNNDFYGHSVTVAGLLHGKDIINQVKDKEFERIILPETLLREFQEVLLDNITLDEMSKILNAEVVISKHDGSNLYSIL